MIQTVDENTYVYEDPTIQINRHCLQLKHWLNRHNFPTPPFAPLVVISNPNTIIEVNGDPKHYQHVIRGGAIYEKVFEYEKTYQRRYISKLDLSRLANRLIEQHTPEKFDILEFLKVQTREILT